MIARIRGRRAALAANWRDARVRGAVAGASDDQIWDALLAEFEWLYAQMTPELRGIVDPVFAIFELKTLVLCLRARSVQRIAEVERLLQHSLLAAPVKDALRRMPDLRTAVSGVDAAVDAALNGRLRLDAAYSQGGLKAVEARLMRGYLEHAAEARLHPAVQGFLKAFIDLRNLMTLYKHLRWGIHDPADFVRGGGMDIQDLRQASARHDGAYLDAAVREVAGRSAPAAAAGEGALESVLLRAMARKLGHSRREGGDIDVILDYAWCLYVDARNRAVLLHAGALGHDALERELVA